jgi:DNA-directed RNA polymerase subunit F
MTGYILDVIVEMGKKLRKRVAGVQPKPESEVKAILNKELEDLLCGSALDDAINPLLGVEGKHLNCVARCAPTDLR